MAQAVEVEHCSNGARLVSVEGRDLPLRSVAVTGRAKGGLARVVLKQTFANPHAQPLKVTYIMPLPAEGAVAAYEFRIGERRVVGEIDGRAKARERFEQALVEGRSAGLLDQERVNLFTQEIGNVPPRTEVRVELTIDQPLAWLAEGMWEWRFPTVAAPRYLGAEGVVPDARNVTVEVAGGPTGVSAALDFAIEDLLPDGRRPESTSHALSTSSRGGGWLGGRGRGATTKVTLAGEKGTALDRDLVVRWPVPRPRTGVTLQTARPAAPRESEGSDCGPSRHAYGLLTIVPPETPGAVYPRDLIVLLDTSGSMTGLPFEQARRVVGALIDSLTDEDRLEMIAFASRPQRWRTEPVVATAEARREAHLWLKALEAGGATEMLHAIEEALKPLRPDAQRQVVLVTDGDIGFEKQIVSALLNDLPRGSRLHAVGVGAAPNRALTRPTARAGRGVEVLAALGEDAERPVARIVAATRGPAVVDLEIDGSAVASFAPHSLPDLMAGTPVLVGLALRPEGGKLFVRGRTPAGPWEERLTVPPTPPGTGSPALTALYGRETVNDLEMDIAGGADRGEINRAIEATGIEFGIATRLTSWVAISEEPTVDPRLPVRREVIPQELPHGMSAEWLGLGRMGMPMLALSVGNESLVMECRIPMAPTSDLPKRRSRVRGYVEEPAYQRRAPSATPQQISSRSVSGRWVGVTAGGGQILEFQVTDAPLDWRPGERATIELRDGRRMDVLIIVPATTMAQLIAPGSLVRLGLPIDPAHRKEIVAIGIVRGQTLLRIEV